MTAEQPAAPNWEHQGDGIWKLPVDGGVLLTTESSSEDRARFAEEWAKGTKPEASEKEGRQ